MWFVADDHTVVFTTFESTKKLGRIRRDPRASFLVESGERWAELSAVHLSGTIEAVEDPAEVARLDALLDEKYAAFRTTRSTMPARHREALQRQAGSAARPRGPDPHLGQQPSRGEGRLSKPPPRLMPLSRS